MITALQMYQAEHSPQGTYGYLDTTRIRADSGSQFTSTAMLIIVLLRISTSYWLHHVSSIKTIWPNVHGRQLLALPVPSWFMPACLIPFGTMHSPTVLTSSMHYLCGVFSMQILTSPLPPKSSSSEQNHASATSVSLGAL